MEPKDGSQVSETRENDLHDREEQDRCLAQAIREGTYEGMFRKLGYGYPVRERAEIVAHLLRQMEDA